MISSGIAAGSRYTHVNILSPVATVRADQAPVNECSRRPAEAGVCCAKVPDFGAGLLTQFQPSPPSELGEAPAGRASSTKVMTEALALNVPLPKTRRPSGHVISTSTHCAPGFFGVTTNVEPKSG